MKLDADRERILTFVLQKDAPELLWQIPHLSVSNAIKTGKGEYIDFTIGGEVRAENSRNGLIGTKLAGVRDDIPDCVRFMVVVSNGVVKQLEIFLNSVGDYPESLEGLDLQDLGNL